MSFFNKTVTQIDKAVKFVKRKSKLGAKLFTEILIRGCLSDPQISLERLCQLAKGKGVEITKQGLHQRFNKEAMLLMSNLFKTSLSQFKVDQGEIFDLLKSFTAIKMRDSSHISLPDVLKDTYKGCGSSGSKAGLKIQVLYDYVDAQLAEVVITKGHENDQGFEGHLKGIQKDELLLQDLGYFKVASFVKIAEQEAFFISRYLSSTTLLDEKGQPFNVLNFLQEKEGGIFSKQVLLGKAEKLSVRFIAYRLSDKQVEKRIRDIRKKYQKKGKTPSKEILELARWSIYVTNVPQNILAAHQVHLVYTLRWQIELFFKVCKSDAGIDKVSGRKINRILCEIYAKLICIVALLYFCFPLKWQGNQEISFHKAYKLFQLRAGEFFRALRSPYLLIKFIKDFMSNLKDFAFKDRHRKKRRLAYQQLIDATAQEAFA